MPGLTLPPPPGCRAILRLAATLVFNVKMYNYLFLVIMCIPPQTPQSHPAG